MNGALSHGDGRTQVPAPAEAAHQGQASQSLYHPLAFHPHLWPHGRALSTPIGISRPGFPMAIKYTYLTVTPIRSVPESQCAGPELQATYLLSTVWTYAGQNMNLYWFSSRGGLRI